MQALDDDRFDLAGGFETEYLAVEVQFRIQGTAYVCGDPEAVLLARERQIGVWDAFRL